MKLLTPKQYDRRVIFSLIAIPLGFVVFISLAVYDLIRWMSH